MREHTIASDLQISIESSPVALLVVDRAGTILHTNRVLDQLLGYDETELMGTSVDTLVPPHVRQHHAGHRARFAQRPSQRAMGNGRDLQVVHKNGSTIAVEIGLHPQAPPNETTVVSLVDVRQRLASETNLKQALDATGGALVRVDRSGQIEFANQRTKELFGYAPEELLGLPIETLIPARYHAHHHGFRADYVQAPTARSMGTGRDLYALRRNGTEFPVEIGLMPVAGTSSVMATIIDITARKARERKIHLANEALRQANTELFEVGYRTSHDLKAPLASISGLLTACLEDVASGELEDLPIQLQEAITMAERLGQRIKTVLSETRNRERALLEPVDVARHVYDAWELVRSDRVRLETDFAHAPPIVSVPHRLDTILENLLANAVKFRRSGVDSVVRVSTRSVDETLVIDVWDNGVGVSPKEERHLFTRHRRGNRRASGTGIGLALVLSNARSLDGKVSFDGAAGTLFTVTLPQPVGETHAPPSRDRR